MNFRSSLRLPTAFFAAAALLAPLTGCDDDSGTDPMADTGQADVSVTALAFGDRDINLGASATQMVTVRNSGAGALMISGVTTSGPFSEGTGTTSVTLSPSQEVVFEVAFDPQAEGAAEGSLAFTTDDPARTSVSVALTGSGAVYRYQQVDRQGIPALNTVFNHPPAFSKTAYNTAGPSADLGSYAGQFEVVLGAVANADPSGTARLLLPDALPVSLGASPSAFGSLTGRALADDAVDVALTVVVGVPGLQSDNVDSNDVPFLTEFPYLAPAN